MVVYVTPCVCVNFKEEDNILFVKWEKKPDTTAFKNAYTRVLQLAKVDYPTTLFCVDMSVCGSFDVEQENWLNYEYYLEVFTGIKDNVYAAIVFSEEHFKAIISNYKAMEKDTFHAFMHLNYFTETKEAFNWLNSIKKGQDAALLPNNFA